MKTLELDNRFIELVSQIGMFHGFDKLCSVIFGILYLEPRELTMDDIAKRTGYSLPSISNSMKLIEKTGFLKIIRKPKTKQLFFFIEKDMSRHVKEMVEKMHKVKIVPAKETLPSIISEYKELIRKNNDTIAKEKLKIIESYYHYILKSEKILDVLLKEMNC
jgi:DNA-binding transcriptional regulator GbsR (MarR family)